MVGRKNDSRMLKGSVVAILLCCMIGVIAFKVGVLQSASSDSDGLSGIVSVKGTVKEEALKLTRAEVGKLNRVVDEHKGTFTKVDLFLDAKGDARNIKPKTVLIWAMVLETNGECEVRSWSRKIPRAELVQQMVQYMNKAAKEYEQFKKFPDVKQNFKCLYI
ncbi:hypothetical protein [uncultured Pseudodesulfovibrio sp.]|uniref:hypothetical protein n=1 Tax=uncultured Pseudodesulfovibrio sp. TaxID=2035858 RepID=UPI0029C73B8F|nr:hypothetical protein [uncultured Pseudodesulfovibrio sp.]